jgi:hypothetical protein
MPQDQTSNLNCQVRSKMKEDLLALARSHERSASAEIRLAIRSHLEKHQRRDLRRAGRSPEEALG